MQFLSKTTAEEKRSAMQKKARAALKEKEKERLVRSAQTAKLRALRLARDAEIESAGEKTASTEE